jgi:hypothetical protein
MATREDGRHGSRLLNEPGLDDFWAISVTPVPAG